MCCLEILLVWRRKYFRPYRFTIGWCWWRWSTNSAVYDDKLSLSKVNHPRNDDGSGGSEHYARPPAWLTAIPQRVFFVLFLNQLIHSYPFTLYMEEEEVGAEKGLVPFSTVGDDAR